MSAAIQSDHPMHLSTSTSSPDTIAVLNHVLGILRQSFTQYLRYARPYIPPNCVGAWEMLVDIAAAEDALAERVGEQLMAAGARPNAGEFATEFTDTHDLGIDYLIREAIDCQRQDIAELEACTATPGVSPVAQSLVAEALGMAKGHLESLQELKPRPGASTIVGNGEPVYKND
jgi:hypothetical protein